MTKTMRGLKITRSAAEMVMSGKLDKILLAENLDVVGETMYMLDDRNAFGRISISKRDKINNVFAYSFSFRPFKRPVPYKRTSNFAIEETPKFDDAYLESLDFIKDIKNYVPKNMRDDVLIDDWRIILAWYSSLKSGRKMPMSQEDIENLALAIMKEMMVRGIKLSPDKYTQNARELYDKTIKRIREKKYFMDELATEADSGLANVNPSGNVLGGSINITQFMELMREFKIASPWVNVVGGIVENGATEGDIDILIREEGPNLPLEFRICRQLPPAIASRVHFLYDVQHFGPFTSYVPLFDKMAVMHGQTPYVEMENNFSADDIESEFAMTKPFGHPAGQGFTARTIVKYITPHHKFVEPFAGGAAVFFTKKPSDAEVLNDLNDNYVSTYRIIKSLTDAEIEQLRKFNWKSDRDTWWKCKANLKAKTYSSKLHRLWNFIYWSKFAYNGGVGWGAWSKFKEGKSLNIPFEQIRDRLKNTTIMQVDYKDCIREHDSESTFFYIDPPYYPADDPRFKSAKIGGIDMDEFAKICSGLKGKCIISLGRDEHVLKKFDSSKFRKKLIPTKYGYGWQTQKSVEWPVLLNFDETKEKIGSHAYEDSGMVDMPDNFQFENIGDLDLEE